MLRTAGVLLVTVALAANPVLAAAQTPQGVWVWPEPRMDSAPGRRAPARQTPRPAPVAPYTPPRVAPPAPVYIPAPPPPPPRPAPPPVVREAPAATIPAPAPAYASPPPTLPPAPPVVVMPLPPATEDSLAAGDSRAAEAPASEFASDLAGGPPPPAIYAMPAPAEAQFPRPPAAAGPLVAFVVRDGTPSLTVMTAGQIIVIGGLAGGLVAMAEGRRLAKLYNIQDPGDLTAAEIATALAEARGGGVAQAPIVKTDNKGANLVVKNVEGARYAVDVETSMVAIYFPFDWGRYGLVYRSTVRIHDLSTNKIVATKRCLRKPEKTPASPSWTEMTANQGEGLKIMIEEARQRCMPELVAATVKR